MLNHDALHALLGRFVLTFQAVEAKMVELTVQIVDADPEYVATLTAELEFNAKARALEVIYARYAETHSPSDAAPRSEIHQLMTKILDLATRRNELVHSFYAPWITVDGEAALARTPTRLKPSKGVRKQEGESILSENLEAEIIKMQSILQELEKYRLQVIDINCPDQ
jgi:hypothetical protein